MWVVLSSRDGLNYMSLIHKKETKTENFASATHAHWTVAELKWARKWQWMTQSSSRCRSIHFIVVNVYLWSESKTEYIKMNFFHKSICKHECKNFHQFLQVLVIILFQVFLGVSNLVFTVVLTNHALLCLFEKEIRFPIINTYLEIWDRYFILFGVDLYFWIIIFC